MVDIAAQSSDGGAPAVAREPIRARTGILCLLVLCVQLLPSVPFYFKVAQSMAAGTVIAAAVCILVVAMCWVIAGRRPNEGLLDISAGGPALIGAVVLLVIVHGIGADQMQRIETGRFIASLVPLVLLLGGGLALSTVLRTARASQITTLSWVTFWVMCAIIALHLTGLQPGTGRGDKSTFPFDELSHFALAFGPVFLYRCATSRGRLRRDFWVILGFALAVLLKSATLVAVALIAAFICRRLLICVALGAVVAAVGLTVELKYFTSRADISNDSTNTSALVYLEGWEMMGESMDETDGWGVGFQQLGVHGSGTPAAAMIERMTGGGDLNLTDGGFVMAKLGSEFGVAGLLVVLGFCLVALKSVLRLRSGRGPPVLTFARSIVAAYSVDMFIRGTGYFTESTLLFIGALLVLAPEAGLLRAGRGANLQHLLVLR